MKSILIIGLMLLMVPLSAQDLPLKRKGALGIQMHSMTDSIAKIKGVQSDKGVYILWVAPQSTSDLLGLAEGDVLLKVNGTETNSITAVLDAIVDLRADDPIKMEYNHQGKLIKKEGKAVAVPKETFDLADITYGTVTYPDNRLRSILYTPKGVEQAPVVYFIQGYTCGSVEFSRFPDYTVMKLIQDWVRAGYAVYRVEKANVGDSDCKQGCYETNFTQEVEGFRQGYLALKNQKTINPNQIFLFGHSMGGAIAPILAKEFNSKGVITYGTFVRSWFEYMQELTRVQGEMFQSPYDEIERDLKRSMPFWYALYEEQLSNDEILKDTTFSRMLADEGLIEAFKNGQFNDRHYTYWQSLSQVSLYNTWLEVKSHVLALYGEFDIQALNDTHIKTIAGIVNSKQPGNATYKVIPNADHGFVYFESMADNIAALNNGDYLAKLRSNYHEGIASETIQWMNKILKS